MLEQPQHLINNKSIESKQTNKIQHVITKKIKEYFPVKK
jgi:hypothetical protein